MKSIYPWLLRAYQIEGDGYGFTGIDAILTREFPQRIARPGIHLVGSRLECIVS